MQIEDAYNSWSSQYDSNDNKTRDLEAIAIRDMLSDKNFEKCLEIGCGTGKNTVWLVTRSKHVKAIDVSEEMLTIARKKVNARNVSFFKADINTSWGFADDVYDLVSFSLVLEHIEKLDDIFQKVSEATAAGGYIYIGELHPFKQYTGTKARFETETGRQEVRCFNHHLSDFTEAGKKYGFEITRIKEYFDEDDRGQIPRILSILFLKK